MIKVTQIDYANTTPVNINTPLHFSGFLFYVNSWNWLNLPENTNYDLVDGVVRNISRRNIDYSGDPESAIQDIIQNRELPGQELTLFEKSTKERLYYIASTCKRYLMNTTERKAFKGSDNPLDAVRYTPTTNSMNVWNLWAGDLQAYTTTDTGTLEVGSDIVIKDLRLQDRSPISIKGNINTEIGPGGFGERDDLNFITNYVNDTDVLESDECLSINNGWYGLVTKSSTPSNIDTGVGIDFDTFIYVVDGKVQKFSSLYSTDYTNNLSLYGTNYTDIIDLNI